MGGIGHQVVAAQVTAEYVLADGDAVLLAKMGEAVGVKGLLRAFHDEGRGIVFELVRVCPNPTSWRFFEDERKGIVEFLMGA